MGFPGLESGRSIFFSLPTLGDRDLSVRKRGVKYPRIFPVPRKSHSPKSSINETS
jgi:hypothetical protein